MVSKGPKNVYHDVVQDKTKRKVRKEASKTEQREKHLLREYRSLRKRNVFIDQRGIDRVHKKVSNKLTKAQKFVLDDLEIFSGHDTLGFASADALPQSQDYEGWNKNKKLERLVRFKQARAEHVSQVQEDKELFEQLDDAFKQIKDEAALQKFVVKKQKIELEEQDIDFNQYLTMFSLPSNTTLRSKNVLKEVAIRPAKGFNKESTSILARSAESSIEMGDPMEELESETENEAKVSETNISRQEEVQPSKEISEKQRTAKVDVPREESSATLSESDRSNCDEDILTASEDSFPQENPSFCQRDTKKNSNPTEMSLQQLEKLNYTKEKAVDSSHDDSPPIQSTFHSSSEAKSKPSLPEGLIESLGRFYEEVEGKCDLIIMNKLTKQISQLIRKAPEQAQSVIRKMISDLDHEFSKRKQNENGPSRGGVFLLHLFLRIFPYSEAFDPISQSSVLLLCRYLKEGEHKEFHQILLSLFIADIVNSALGKRFCPETLEIYKRHLDTIRKNPSWIREEDSDSSECMEFTFLELINGPNESGFWTRVCLRCLLAMENLSEKYQKASCFPEIFESVTAAVEEISKLDGLSEKLREQSQRLFVALKTGIVDRATSRRPLRRTDLRASSIRERAPLFEDTTELTDLRKWKQEEMMDRKTLKKKINQERRAAIKELRKDAGFLAEIREKDKKQVDEERLKNEKAFYSELRRFDEDLRQGGQAGMNPHLKKDKKRLWKY